MALANVIAPPDIVETGTLTPASGITFTFADVRKEGNVVSVAIRISTSLTVSNNSWKQIAVIPEGFRPTNEIDLVGINNVDDSTIHLRVYQPSGIISFYGYVNESYQPYFHITYVI